MDKNVIETLIELCNEGVRVCKKHISYINGQQGNYELITDYQKDIDHLNKCLDQLQKLKEFNIPVDDEIETYYREYLPKEGVEYCIIGAKVMRDNIKFKLS